MSARYKKHRNYQIGYADALKSRGVNPDFQFNPPYCEGFAAGEYFRKALTKRGFRPIASEHGSITFSLKL